MKRKINLTESELRRIVRKVILRDEKYYLSEVTSKKETGQQGNTTAVNKSKKSSTDDNPVKEFKYEELIKATGDTNNLAVKTSGTADRVLDITAGVATASGVAGGVGGIMGAVTAAEFTLGAVGAASIDTFAGIAAGLVGGPVGWGALGVAAVAGLYYLFTPETTGTNATKEALDTTLYDRVYSGFNNIYRELKKSEFDQIRQAAERINPKACLRVPPPDEATKLAERIYNATQGGTLGLGFGTDEEGIESALKACNSFLGVSLVSKKHAKMYEGIIDDGDLLKVFTGELDNADMERYVNSVIETLPYIIINDKEFTKEEFQDWLVANKKACDELLSNLKNDLIDQNEEQAEGQNTEAVEPPYVELIQKTINEYCSQKSIKYEPLSVDNVWGPKTEALWSNIYIPHVFAEHPTFSSLGISISNSKWEFLSRQLIKKFPGYTSGSKGCARFCVDSLYGNTVQGEKEGGSDSAIKYSKGNKKQKRTDPTPEKGDIETLEKKEKNKDYEPLGDGRLTYKNIKIDVDTVGDRNIRELNQLPGAPSDADSELKYDFLTNFGTRRLDIPPGETFQLHIMPKKNGKIKLQHVSTKMFKTMGIRKFADPFYRFFMSLNMSDANIKKLTMKGKSPIIIKVIMPGGLYNPAVER